MKKKEFIRKQLILNLKVKNNLRKWHKKKNQRKVRKKKSLLSEASKGKAIFFKKKINLMRLRKDKPNKNLKKYLNN